MTDRVWLGLLFAIGLPLAFLAAGVLVFFEGHPHPLREWRLWRGPQESCPRCHAEVPLGWMAYERGCYKPLFDLKFEDRMDGSYVMRGWGAWYGGGRICALCETRFPDGGKTQRPKLFEYHRNEAFGKAAVS